VIEGVHTISPEVEDIPAGHKIGGEDTEGQ